MAQFFDAYGPAFLGLQLHKLLSEIDRSGTEALSKTSARVPSRLSSSLVYLKHCGPCSITELAQSLSMSHQLIGQRLELLRKHKLIKERVDPNDGRKSLIQLSALGVKAANEIESVGKIAAKVYVQLFDEIGIDVFDGVVKLRRALNDRSLDLRIREAAKAKNKRAA